MSEPTEETRSLLDDLLIQDVPTDQAPESAPNPKVNRRPMRERIASKPAPKVKEKVAPHKKGEFIEPLTEMYTMVGVVMTPFDQHCGPIIIAQANPCAVALDDLAAKNENVRKALRSLTAASAMGAVISAHAPIMLAILAHHMPGAVPQFVQPTPREDDISGGE